MNMTISLAGSEAKAEFSGANAWLRNDGTDVIYAAAKPGITSGADGVVAIPAGQSAPVYGANGTVWLTGTGSVQLIGSDYSTNPFKTSAQAGGSGADNVARAAISAHSGNAEIHVTAEEKAAWNAINYSNPNLLINPDFRINQRGQSAYTVGDYTVDRWKLLNANGTLTVTDSGVIASKNTGATGSAAFYQKLEIDDSFGDVLSLSVCVDGQIYSGQLDVPASGNSVASLSTPCGVWNLYRPSNSIIQLVCVLNENTAVINWAKLEKGSISTPYVAPAPGAELAECQRFYQIRSTNDIDPVDLRPSMRATPTDIKQVTGGYAYVAEL